MVARGPPKAEAEGSSPSSIVLFAFLVQGFPFRSLCLLACPVVDQVPYFLLFWKKRGKLT
jgi:hypothetical protein